ncbi:MAG: hypothetical protein DI537_05170 [Stutzerimonas stutzeri]|nr:MAG: hypothetical protein DI537_05170 [Stutzerimonas stutzeri]
MSLEIESLANLDEEEFLAGEERCAQFEGGGAEGDIVVIDDVFAKTVDQILADYPCTIHALTSHTASLRASGFMFAEHDSGVVLLNASDEIAGVYLGADVAIAERHQGLGLGAELVLERVLRNGGSPVWELSLPCYTRAGYRAHSAAWRMLRDKPLLRQKMKSLELAYAASAFIDAAGGA